MRIKLTLTAIVMSTLVLVSSPAIGDQFGVPNENARGYWNADKMAKATPIELVVDEITGIGKIAPAAGARGGGKAKTSGSTTLVATTDWPNNAPIAQTAVGKVFFTIGTAGYVCSGALVKESDSNRAIVLTAGHCVWSQSSTDGNFVTNWAFVPNYDQNPSNPIWYASALVVRNEFASQTSFNSTSLANDWAFAVLQPNTNGLPDNNGLNAYELVTTGFTTANPSFAFGYPADAPFNGLSLKYAGATIFVDPNTKTTWGMNSTMTGGASGGPWLSNGVSKDGASYGLSGKLSSLNSYKYSKDSTKMYGPFFNARTLTTFAAALAATTNARVSN